VEKHKKGIELCFERLKLFSQKQSVLQRIELKQTQLKTSE
jgi:hypothetical protein